jgi:hypothetical protein
MAQVSTYDIVGKKEDVSGVINNISPTDYPFTSLTGSENVKAVLFQWQEDSLRAPAANAQTEGFTPTPGARAATVMRSNVTQIFQDTFQVAATTDAVSTYGRAKESAYQAAKAMESLKADLEFAFVGNDAAQVTPSDNTTARVFAGVQRQIAAANVVKTGLAATAVDEAHLLTAMQKAYNGGAKPSVILCTPARALTIADFAKASGRYRVFNNGTRDRALINVVDLYVSPFGEQKVVISRHIKHVAADDTGADTLLMEPKQWSKVTLRPWTRETLAKTGDNTAMMIVGEFSLKHKNQLASAIVRESA